MKKILKRSIITFLVAGAIIASTDIPRVLRIEYPPGRGCFNTQYFQQLLK